MLNKTLVIFLVISMISSSKFHKISKAHKSNLKQLKRHSKIIANSHKHHKKNLNNLTNQFKNIKKINNHITKNGIKMSHDKYNKVLLKYSKMIKSYNKNRQNVCAKLPPLWSLKRKSIKDLTPDQVKCKVWFYKGKVLGANIGNANYYLGNYNSSSWWLKRRYTNMKNTLFLRGASRKVNTLRRCFNNGFVYQMTRSINGSRLNNKSMTTVKAPFKSLQEKRNKIRSAIRNLDRVMKK